MPIKDLKSDLAIVDWSVGRAKIDKRQTYRLKRPELQVVSSSYPYTIRLKERPYKEPGVAVTGLTEVLILPINPSKFYVDYEDSTLHFHSSKAGKLMRIRYYGMGSVVAANDINKFANFLCSVKGFLTSFLVEASDPINTNVNIVGGYINTGTSLINTIDKTLKFGTGQEYEVTVTRIFFWRKILVSVNISTGEIIVSEGAEALTQPTAITPGVPLNCRPCAIVSVQDNGEGSAGTIRSITSSRILDVRNTIK
jgi:hypothetical protein